MKRWIRSHLSLVATATSVVVVAALVAVVAIVSTGYTAQRLDLDDASVWVSNSSERFIGRANTEVLELNTVVPGSGSDIDVVQRGSTVLMFDRADATLEIVDPATSVVSQSVPLPPAQPGVFLAGDNGVVYSEGSGEIWIVPIADLADFDAEQEPTLSLGAGSVVSVDENGQLFAFSREAHKVYRVDAAASAEVTATDDTELGGDEGEFAVTSVAGRWAVLDVDTNQLEVAGRVVELGDAIGDGNAPVLQRASVTGKAVRVAYSGGLLDVSLSNGDVRAAFDGASGTAAAPVVVGDCTFAAWSNGAAWKLCDDTDKPTVLQLDMPGNAVLDFQVNGSRLLLNDSRGGASWAVQFAGELIDNWNDLITVDENQQQVEQNDEDTPPEVEKDQLPPVAVNDEFGARPGRTSLLPVLLNDYDPNADVLVVTSVTPVDESVGRIDVIESGQALQLTLVAGAQGAVSFEYTIDDGRGGSASASVDVTVRSPGENSPPRQVRNSRATVASSGQVTVPVLDDWIDPDGDPFYLAEAAVASPMVVSYKPDGTVIVTDGGSLGTSTVSLVVSDGTASANGSLTVTTRALGDVPIVADPFVVAAYSGQEITISPLEHVRGGNGAVRLNAVPPKTGITITPSYETGTFRFETDEVRSHYVEFVVTDNDQTVTGLVRVDVTAPPDANTKPITIPKTVFIPTLSSRTVDVAGTDIDPAGGVLLVTGVTDVPVASGIRAEVLEQRSVRVTLTGPLAAPVSFGYRITNGLAEAVGTITVVEVAPPARLQPPIARDDSATVRVGDAITIDVMRNDEQPDGEPITLNPVLVDGLSGDSGLLFVSGNSLRYLAPATTGNFTAVYEVIGPLGQTAQAQVSIEVREPNDETNHPPVPTTVIARVIAGDSVTIDIPLDGIDPDGDSVQLLGQETSPEKGGVVAVGTSTIEYEAGVYSAGTDSFTYTVTDSLGARATGTVRIGISPPLADARNPVAIEDEVNVRPGATVSVRVLANDSDPDGSTLRVVAVQPNDENLVATIDDDTIVDINAPDEPGTYGLVYTIENEVGGSSSNFVSVIVSADAPRAYPVARDTVLTLTDVLDRTTINVDVLANVFFADGAASDLDLSIVAGYADSARVTSNKQIRVTITDERQIIPFAVTNPDDPSARSFAFIWVPGFKDALPQLNRDAPRLQVVSEEALTIDLNDYVLAVDGKRVRLTDSSTVRATHSDGSSLVVDSNTLTFSSADLYFGPASISFEVTDGTSATDPAGHKANLVLSITVNPRENQPPVFTGATLEFEPGQKKVVDLTQVTNYPYSNDIDELAYSVLAPFPEGFDYQLDGQSLTITARDTVAKNTATAISLGVRDALAQGQAGRIQLRVVRSTRPLAVPAADTAFAKRNQSTVVDVLANDQATNPFPKQPLRVIAVRGIDGASLPAGVTVSASSDNSKLTVTVGANAAPIDTLVQYQVSDASRDPDRNVWGSVRISVQDVPDAPAKPVRQASGFGDPRLVLRITAPQPNNSPITNYRVVSATGNYSFDCGTTLICTLPGLTIGEPYRLQVIATNAMGDSAASAASDPFSVDYLPAAPDVTAVPADAAVAPSGGAVTVSWPTVPDPSPGTAVTGYTVEFNNESRNVGRTTTSTTFTGLPTATEFTVRVYARNSAQVSSPADWVRSTEKKVTTVGLPIAPARAPAAVSGLNGEITVTWDDFGANGGGVVTYGVRRSATGSAAPSSCSPANTTGAVSGWTDSDLDDGRSYTYYIFASNGRYCSVASTGPAESKKPPGQASGKATLLARGDTGQLDAQATDLSASGIVDHFELSYNQVDTAAVVEGQWLTSAANTAVYGSQLTVYFRACRDATASYCGPWSAPVIARPLNARAAIESCVVGLDADPGIVRVLAPTNGGVQTVSYEASFNQPLGGVIPDWGRFAAYTEGDPVPLGTTSVRIKATVSSGGDTWTDPGYVELDCTTP